MLCSTNSQQIAPSEILSWFSSCSLVEALGAKRQFSDGFHEWKRLGKEMSSRMHDMTSISEKSNMISQGFFNHFYSPCKHTLLLAKQMCAHMPSSSTRHRLGQVRISVHQFLLWIQRMLVSSPYESLCVSKVVRDVKFLKGCLAHCEHLIMLFYVLCILYNIHNSLSHQILTTLQVVCSYCSLFYDQLRVCSRWFCPVGIWFSIIPHEEDHLLACRVKAYTRKGTISELGWSLKDFNIERQYSCFGAHGSTDSS